MLLPMGIDWWIGITLVNKIFALLERLWIERKNDNVKQCNIEIMQHVISMWTKNKRIQVK